MYVQVNISKVKGKGGTCLILSIASMILFREVSEPMEYSVAGRLLLMVAGISTFCFCSKTDKLILILIIINC